MGNTDKASRQRKGIFSGTAAVADAWSSVIAHDGLHLITGCNRPVPLRLHSRTFGHKSCLTEPSADGHGPMQKPHDVTLMMLTMADLYICLGLCNPRF